jgi:hypothetical protein
VWNTGTGDPGDGVLMWSYANPITALDFNASGFDGLLMVFGDVDADGTDVMAAVRALSRDDLIYLTDTANPANYQVWEAGSSPWWRSNGNNFWTVDIWPIDPPDYGGTGIPGFPDGTDLAITLEGAYQGPTGPAGPSGLAGPPGEDGDDGAVLVYEQPDDPGDVPLGSLWIDTDSVVGEEE